MATTLSAYVNEVAGKNAGDLQPLVANDTYSRAVNAELTSRAATVTATAAELARHEDVSSGVAAFSTAMGAIRAVAKRFPETAKHMDDAAKSVQLAMGVVAYNPQPLPTDKALTPRPGILTPLRPFVIDATTLATPPAPPPPVPPAPPAPPAAPAALDK